jgi:hypothetical protein
MRAIRSFVVLSVVATFLTLAPSAIAYEPAKAGDRQPAMAVAARKASEPATKEPVKRVGVKVDKKIAPGLKTPKLANGEQERAHKEEAIREKAARGVGVGSEREAARDMPTKAGDRQPAMAGAVPGVVRKGAEIGFKQLIKKGIIKGAEKIAPGLKTPELANDEQELAHKEEAIREKAAAEKAARKAEREATERAARERALRQQERRERSPIILHVDLSGLPRPGIRLRDTLGRRRARYSDPSFLRLFSTVRSAIPR